jgi:hypothetical protein
MQREPTLVTHAPDPLEAFRWWQEHSALDVMVAALVEAIDADDASAAREAADELAHALDAHAHEEEDVYFPIIERLAPEQADAVRAARAVHVEIRADVDALRDELRGDDVQRARPALVELLDLFHGHEQAETRLIAELAERSPANRSD